MQQARNCPPVVVITGSAEDSDRERAFALGAVAYFIKPNGLVHMTHFAQELKESWLAPLSRPA
jgi:CheY-like chemotaxis protein